MTTAASEAPATPADELQSAEHEAEREIAALIAGLVAAGVTAAAILALIGAFTAVVSAGARTGWEIGARLVLVSGSRRRVRRGAFRVTPLPTSVPDDVAVVVADAARRVAEAVARQEEREARDRTSGGRETPSGGTGARSEGATTTGPPAGPEARQGRTGGESEVDREVRQFQRRMERLAVTKIHQAASAATFSYAEWLGLDLEWVTRRDGACPVCAAMNGRRVSVGERFTPPRGPGMPRALWAGFQGLPPVHPHCRCRCIPRPPRTQRGGRE